MINELLQQLGFGTKEIAVYLAILEQGKATPAQIARLTKINRTTVYSIASELVNKGVISEDIAGKQTYLVALRPQDLVNLVKKEELELANKKILIENAVSELEKLTKNTQYSIPKIQFIFEQDIKSFLYSQSPIWSKSMQERDNTWWGFNDTSAIAQNTEWIDWYWDNHNTKGFQVKLLTNQSDTEQTLKDRAYSQNRLIKYWNKGDAFTAATWVCGDYVIMLISSKKPNYLVQIYDETMASNLREMFKGIWELI